MGKPVVAFKSGGIPEVISHGSTGFLAEERDCEALAEYLWMLLGDTELRKRFGQAGRQAMLRRFDVDHCTKRLENIYRMVLDTNRRQIGRADDAPLSWNSVSNTHNDAACSRFPADFAG
jgi:glycogen synthase